jgi:hypothetical protein
MASGDPVVRVIQAMPPGASFSTLDVRPGGSTPAESAMIFDFDDTAIEYMDFLCELVGYGGGGLTFTLPWSATTATSGSVRWGVAIRRLEDDVDDIDSSHTYAFNEVTDAAPSASGELSYPTISFTDGSDMDDWADGELAIVRVRRDATNGGDDMTGDAELWAVSGKET